jgi:tetratricopeptide (TPR) repeat protein
VRAENFREAIAAFEAGYAASPRPEFLLNIANCHRKLDDLAAARRFYRRFLDQAPADHPARPQSIEYLRAIEQIVADGLALDSRPVGPPAPSLETVPAVDEPPASAMLAASVATDTSGGGSVLSRWWFWTLVGSAAAASVVVAVSLSSGSGCNANLGCLRE